MRECDRDNGQSIAILQGMPDEFKEWLGARKIILTEDLKTMF